VRVAEELVSREKVRSWSPARFLSNIGLALTDFAKQRKVLFVAAEPLTDKIVWENGNRYTFRLRPVRPTCRPAMLVPEAAEAEEEALGRSSIPNYEYGQSAAATFKELLKAAPAGRRVRRRAGHRRSAASTPAQWCRR
jgi:branched-chain amino acid transport system substrate-binding protein